MMKNIENERVLRIDNVEKTEQIWKPEPGGHLALKPCPFCGNKEPVYLQYNTKVGLRWMVLCLNCMASIDPGWAQHRSRVQELWNKRTVETE